MPSGSCLLVSCAIELKSAPYFYAVANVFAQRIFEPGFLTRMMAREQRR